MLIPIGLAEWRFTLFLVAVAVTVLTLVIWWAVEWNAKQGRKDAEEYDDARTYEEWFEDLRGD
jgi:hypothetical protein